MSTDIYWFGLNHVSSSLSRRKKKKLWTTCDERPRRYSSATARWPRVAACLEWAAGEGALGPVRSARMPPSSSPRPWNRQSPPIQSPGEASWFGINCSVNRVKTRSGRGSGKSTSTVQWLLFRCKLCVLYCCGICVLCSALTPEIFGTCIFGMN